MGTKTNKWEDSGLYKAHGATFKNESCKYNISNMKQPADQ